MKKSLLFALLLALFTLPAASYAEVSLPEIRTTLASSAKVIEALLIPPAEPASKARAVHREVKVLRTDKTETEVLIETRPEDHVPGTLYTIFSRAESGKLSASPLRALSEVEPAPQEFPTSCQGEARDRKKLEALSEHALQKLIEIRKKKKSLLMQRIKATLNPDLAERLGALEDELGLGSGTPLSRALADAELVQRILVLGSLSATR